MFENVAVDELLTLVRAHDFGGDPMGADRIDAIKACDRVVRAAQAEQSKQIAALDTLRASQLTLGRGDHSLSVIGELGMARNISPGAAGSQYGFAVRLARMPKVAKALAGGGISEQAARLVVRESTGLDLDQVALLDDRLAGRLSGLTARKAANLARHHALSIDPKAAYERARANRSDRFVSLFPDSNGVAVLQVRGPAEQMQAAYNGLQLAANAAKAAGDPRTFGQVMCDEFVQRTTGLTKAKDVGVEIGLVMTMGNLLGTDDNPAHLAGFGPIPSELANRIICSGAQTWIRRLYTDPIDGSLTDCDQKRRRFAGKLATLITRRDHRCRQPGCDSPIKHLDHIIAFHTGGPTTRDNAQGLCVRSHTLKHLPGWTLVNRDGTVIWQTPTGHQYLSQRRPVLEYHYQGTGHLRQ